MNPQNPVNCNFDKSSPIVRAMFCDIAHRYDFLNHLLSGNQDVRWRKRAVRLLGVKRGQRVLDLCCGTGDVAFALARQGTETVGLDFSEIGRASCRERVSSKV